ncbi:MAG: hypothetical protein AAFY28_04080 [Actinomycetota bacterium]
MAGAEMVRFDLSQLFAEVDRERRCRDLSWATLARHVGVSASTLRRFESADDAEADGVLALISWLGTSPEQFIINTSVRGRRLPTIESGFVRVDMKRVTAAHGVPTSTEGRTRTTIQRLVAVAQAAHRPVADLTHITAK